jgi:hypothetical protein
MRKRFSTAPSRKDQPMSDSLNRGYFPQSIYDLAGHDAGATPEGARHCEQGGCLSTTAGRQKSWCLIRDGRNISAQESHGAFASQAAIRHCLRRASRLMSVKRVSVFRPTPSKSFDKRELYRIAGNCHIGYDCCFLRVPSLLACRSLILSANLSASLSLR